MCEYSFCNPHFVVEFYFVLGTYAPENLFIFYYYGRRYYE